MYTNQQIAEYFAMVRASHFLDAQTRVRLAIASFPESLYEYYATHDKSLRGFKISGVKINKVNLETLECICENGPNTVKVFERRIRGIYDRINPVKGVVSMTGHVLKARKGYR